MTKKRDMIAFDQPCRANVKPKKDCTRKLNWMPVKRKKNS